MLKNFADLGFAQKLWFVYEVHERMLHILCVSAKMSAFFIIFFSLMGNVLT